MSAEVARQSTLDVGGIRITYVPDGATRQRPAAQFVGAAPDVWERHPGLLDPDGWLIMSFGSFLIESGRHTALVDLAWGPHSVDLTATSGGALEGDAHGGELIDNLARLGVSPADIDTVLYSHLHVDHVGWVVGEHGATFPNATHVLTETEWEHWRKHPEDDSGVAPSPEQLAVIRESVRCAADGDQPLPGVTLLATPGHTAGHASYVVASDTERVLLLGDAVHCPIEFTDPGIHFMADEDPALARRTKARIVRDFSGSGAVVAGGHFPEPPFGRLSQPVLPQDFQPLEATELSR
jgi:glyoxylase-like metal-dependent hydrolase (beta-lactamase superfamily II)